MDLEQRHSDLERSDADRERRHADGWRRYAHHEQATRLASGVTPLASRVARIGRLFRVERLLVSWRALQLPGILTRVLWALNPRRRIRTAFTQHYLRKDWMEPETVSGRGSTLHRTAAIRRELPALFRELGIRSVLDAGCGDFNWFPTMETALDSYVGIEVVEELAAANQERHGTEGCRFVSLDVTRDDLPRVDLILCRDCLVHLKNGQVRAAIRNFRRSGSSYLLATTFTGEHPNEDVPLGGWRPLNLERAPFDLGPPLRLISERESVEDERYLDKSLGLWSLKATV